MARKMKAARPAAAKGKKKPPSRNALTAQDLAVAGAFIGSIVFALAAFANSVTPLDDSFVLWPLAIGAVVGALIGVAAHRWKPFESYGFVVGVLAFSGAATAVGLVLALNRPLDRAHVQHNFITVINKYQLGSGTHSSYHLEVAGFVKKRLTVEEAIYNGVSAKEQVDVLIRPGFFGYRYLERVQLVSIKLPEGQSLPAVPPPMPLDDLPGKK
jgi:hypothetical protein